MPDNTDDDKIVFNDFTKTYDAKTEHNMKDLSKNQSKHEIINFLKINLKINESKSEDDKIKIDKDLKTNDKTNLDITNTDYKPEHSRLDETNPIKLSTFFFYDTVTKPYKPLYRPTRRNDDDEDNSKINYNDNISKYYYVRNILHKYPDIQSTMTEKPESQEKVNNDFMKENYNNPGLPEIHDSYQMQERTVGDKKAFLEEVESAKIADLDTKKDKAKKPGLHSAAKTPSVAFQVMPSENR